jgi:hypothetical protein
VYDKDLDAGKFLVPGCWNRAINGDYAECHCADGPETVGDQLEALRRRIAALESPARQRL